MDQDVLVQELVNTELWEMLRIVSEALDQHLRSDSVFIESDGIMTGMGDDAGFKALVIWKILND